MEQPTNNLNPIRIFRIGDRTILEDENMRAMNIEDIRSILALQYPEVENASIIEQESEQGTIYNFMPLPGRKG
jgi:hypothetical protein